MKLEDFWSCVAVGSPDECWDWKQRLNTSGYGQPKIGKTRKLATRIAYELTHGPIPTGLLVCHSCDRPSCCNPSHLFLGTHADNMRDAAAKGRLTAKLTEADVRAIRTLRASGATYRDIGKQFNINASMAYYIAARQRWARIPDEA
jgi:hypothetical protein